MHDYSPEFKLFKAHWPQMLCICTKFSPIRDYDRQTFYFKLADHSPIIEGTVTGEVFIDDVMVAFFGPTREGGFTFTYHGEPDVYPIEAEVEHASPHLCLVFNKPVEGSVTSTVRYEYPRS